MQKQADIWKPALISGALFGFLSGVPFLDACCCLWFVGAGVMSSYMVIKGSLEPVTYGRAALTGFVSGLLGSPFFVMTSVIFSILTGGAEEIREAIDEASGLSPAFEESTALIESMGIFIFMAIMLFVMAVFFLIFGTLGGVIGRAIFEKRSPLPPAAPVAGVGPIDPGSGPPPTAHS